MSNNTLSELSVKQLKRAVAIRERLDELQSELASLLGESAAAPAGRGGRRKMSAAARARIAAAQRLRWAKHRKGKAGKGGKGRRKMSAAARAKISKAAKARWAKAKAANRNTLAAA